jgi:hypothetical protein
MIEGLGEGVWKLEAELLELLVSVEDIVGT